MPAPHRPPSMPDIDPITAVHANIVRLDGELEVVRTRLDGLIEDHDSTRGRIDHLATTIDHRLASIQAALEAQARATEESAHAMQIHTRVEDAREEARLELEKKNAATRESIGKVITVVIAVGTVAVNLGAWLLSHWPRK